MSDSNIKIEAINEKEVDLSDEKYIKSQDNTPKFKKASRPNHRKEPGKRDLNLIPISKPSDISNPNYYPLKEIEKPKTSIKDIKLTDEMADAIINRYPTEISMHTFSKWFSSTYGVNVGPGTMRKLRNKAIIRRVGSQKSKWNENIMNLEVGSGVNIILEKIFINGSVSEDEMWNLIPDRKTAMEVSKALTVGKYHPCDITHLYGKKHYLLSQDYKKKHNILEVEKDPIIKDTPPKADTPKTNEPLLEILTHLKQIDNTLSILLATQAQTDTKIKNAIKEVVRSYLSKPMGKQELFFKTNLEEWGPTIGIMLRKGMSARQITKETGLTDHMINKIQAAMKNKL